MLMHTVLGYAEVVDLTKEDVHPPPQPGCWMDLFQVECEGIQLTLGCCDSETLCLKRRDVMHHLCNRIVHTS